MPLRNEPATPDTLLTVPEVAEMLKVSIRSIRRLIAHKELTVVLIGRSVRISSKSLANFIKKNSK
jgi:excisionase family DNA binding protein